MLRIGSDIGGTFTDITVVDDDTGEVTHKKLLTTKEPADAIIGALTEMKIDLANTSFFSHGTTIAINVIIQGNGATTGLVMTKGFRDTLELRRGARTHILDPLMDKPKLFVPRRWRVEVDERVRADGTVEKALDHEELCSVVKDLIADGVESLAICFMHSYAYPAHEQQAKLVLAKRFPNLLVTLSSDVVPEIKEFERTSTAVLNAYCQPVVQRYLDSLQSEVSARGLPGDVHLMQSNGGLMVAQEAANHPIKILESGPASGSIAASRLGARIGIENLITFDMGGTTAKSSVVEAGEPLMTVEYELFEEHDKPGSGWPIRVPITLEVIQNRVDSIVREMGNITLRTARSAVVHSGRDFSCAIFDDKGQLMTIGTSIPVHILPMVVQMKDMLKLYEGDISPGDIFGGNDPHDGGVHLNDVQICIPMFHGDKLVGFAANRAHWTDVGGAVPGSISGKATEIFQEGLRIPSMRLGRGGRPDPDMLRFISRNVRIPREAIGDLMSQLASCKVAEQRIADIVAGYGVDVFQATLEEILNAGERRMRSRIAALPDCTVSHEGYLDNDGTFEDRIKIRSEITIHGEELTVDFSGSAPQSPGCLNVGRGVAEGFAFMGIKAALDPQSTVNAGCFRPIKVIAPQGSCLNANDPAACGGVGELGQAAIITMVALSGLVPDQVSAEESSSINHQNYDGVDTRPGRGRFIFYDAVSMGCGARSTKDGLDFVRTIRSGNYTMMSSEALENIFPILFERQQLLTDSGGPGRFRGGMGLDRQYRVLCDGTISVLGDNALVAPAGVHGGHRGFPTQWQIKRPEGTVPLTPKFHSKGSHILRAGDVVRLSTPGGGGWGDPVERDPERVCNDVDDGKVSLQQARDAYGVVIDQYTGKVDESETNKKRRELRGQRRLTLVERGGSAGLEGGMRRALAGVGAPWAPGSVIEIFVGKRPQPLTVRVVSSTDISPGRLQIDNEAWSDLGLRDSTAEVTVRAVQGARTTT